MKLSACKPANLLLCVTTVCVCVCCDNVTINKKNKVLCFLFIVTLPQHIHTLVTLASHLYIIFYI